MKTNSKFIVFVDHYAECNSYDRYVTLEGKTIIEAMKDFHKKFDLWKLKDSVYLYKMMQKKGRKANVYEDILINRGHGWDYEPSPIEETIADYKIYEKYSV